MKYIRIAFYKNSKSVFAKFIRFKQYRLQKIPWRHSKYSHVEILFDDRWYSSSEVDWGVRMKRIQDNKGNWDYIDIRVNDQEYDDMEIYCISQVSNRYNWIGIFFAQAFNMKITREWDFFCSQFVTLVLQKIKKMCGVDAVFITPWDLNKILSKK